MNSATRNRNWILRAMIFSVLPLAVFSALVIVARPVQAQTETVLYTFTEGNDGGNPYGGLIFDGSGNLYGTTQYGGTYGYGVVFELSPGPNGQRTETVLHSFNLDGQDGVRPFSSLVMDSAGNLFGTTNYGGAYSLGTVFEVSPGQNGGWTERVLHTFNSDGIDGYNPYATLVLDAKGNLYGTTYYGGTGSVGTVFELSPSPDGSWQETIILNFDYTHGGEPRGGVVFDRAGHLYGTTQFGGQFESGVIFELARQQNGTWKETVLHNFGSSGDGFASYSGLVIDKSNRLFGTTLYGGNSDNGAVFEVERVNGVWQESVIHSFERINDGFNPYGPVAIDSAGNLYGMTFESEVNGVGGGGIVFQLSRKKQAWNETILHQFGVIPGDGGNPYSGPVLDSAGNIYGATFNGGNSGGTGVVFEVIPLVVTTTALSSSPNPSTYGQAVILTAVVSSKSGAPPNGETVTFMKGTKVLGTGTLSGGSASFTTSTLPVGTNYIKAVYSGDSTFATSMSKAASQVVNKATTTTALTSSLNPSKVGQSVTFAASVTPQFSGTVKGSVTFYDGTTALKTVALSGGVAKFTTSTLTLGAHSITAKYNGSTSFDGSSASMTQTVN
jgi:uncharacterized repeat protein (TIGR03803 family)